VLNAHLAHLVVIRFHAPNGTEKTADFVDATAIAFAAILEEATLPANARKSAAPFTRLALVGANRLLVKFRASERVAGYECHVSLLTGKDR